MVPLKSPLPTVIKANLLWQTLSYSSSELEKQILIHPFLFSSPSIKFLKFQIRSLLKISLNTLSSSTLSSKYYLKFTADAKLTSTDYQHITLIYPIFYS